MERSKEVTKIPVLSKNFEDVLEEIGGFGLFQYLVLFLLLVLEVPAAFIAFTSVFAAHSPDQWYCNDVPVSKTDICLCNGTRFGTPDTSIVTEWNLVCSSAWVSDFTTSIQMAGMFLGNIVGCKISDWYGRRYTFLGVTILMGIGQGVSAVAFDPYSYGIARFISGVGLSGFLGVTSVYSMEFLTPKYRSISSGLSPWGQGVMLLALIAYYVRPWRAFLWTTTIPFASIIVIFPFVPESPRWLMRNRKISQAHKVLRIIAKVNGCHPVDLATLHAIADSEIAPVEDGDPAVEETLVVKRFGYRQFFRDRALRIPTIYQMLIMCSTAITYYGISLNVKNMKGSPYFIVTLLGLSDAIGYPSALLISNRLGRRTSLAIYMTLGALFLVTLAVLEISIGLRGYPIVVVVLCLLGKFCVAGGRSCARTLVGELYPTAVRAMGSGLGGVGASLGAVIAPQLVFIGSHWPAIPYFVFACIAILGALFSFLLTETMNRPLTDQIGTPLTPTNIENTTDIAKTGLPSVSFVILPQPTYKPRRSSVQSIR